MHSMQEIHGDNVIMTSYMNKHIFYIINLAKKSGIPKNIAITNRLIEQAEGWN